MSREIKFRTVEDGKVVPLEGYASIEDGKIKMDFPVEIIMQYTGLKDKNGKEIYEGDILRRPISPVGGESGDYLYKNEVIKWISASQGFGLYAPGAASEVIGNIYENPELLKDEK